MKTILRTCLTAAALSLGLSTPAMAYQPTPDVYVVFFEASWCGPCKIVEPRLTAALQQLRDPMIEYVPIDISGGHGDANAHAVFDRGIVQQYNMWMGVTGFAAIIDGDTKRTMGCVNMTYDAQAMAMHIRNLQQAAKNNQQAFDLTCPEPNNI